MDIKRAIEILEVRSKFVADINVDAIFAYKEAIKALEKQIPKSTTETQELMDVEYICPECQHINGKWNYCWNCGQKLICY